MSVDYKLQLNQVSSSSSPASSYMVANLRCAELGTAQPQLVTMYDYVWLCITIYDYVWLCKSLWDCVQLCMTMYKFIWLCMTLYDSVCAFWLCMSLYGYFDYVWLAITLYQLDWPQPQLASPDSAKPQLPAWAKATTVFDICMYVCQYVCNTRIVYLF